MAYAYPSGGDGTNSSSSLAAHSSPGKTHSNTTSRKGSGEQFDISREIKVKIDEDENYLQFFQDRIKSEEDYIHGSKKLYSRSKAVDTSHDDAFRREEKPTTRRAWDEVREYSTREIQAKEASVEVLREVIVRELVRLKEEQTRIRQGLKENMKHANEMYEEHAKNQSPRSKRTYWQKCQALEDHKRQEHAITMQAKSLADSPSSPQSSQLKDHPNTFTVTPNTGTYPLSPPTAIPPSPPSSNPAQPAHPSVQFDQISKEEKKHGRLRAGSASAQGSQQAKDVLNDIAAQSKKGFNAIFSKLGGDKGDRDDGGLTIATNKDDGETGHRRTMSARGDPARGMGTMRGVKVKREADEADKAYRSGVFHLESLRSRRDKSQTSAAKNLEAFNDESNRKLVQSLAVYIDTLHATAATNAQGTVVAREAIEAVNSDKDTSLFRSRLRAGDTHRTAPVPYHNYYVGECRSLIFGVSSTDYDFARGEGSDRGRPPTIVEKSIAAIDERGSEAEGIYRISGRHAGVQKLIQEIELDEEKFRFDEKDDVYSISNVLKQYSRESPEPVFHFPQAERVKYTENRETHIHSNFSASRGRSRRLAPIHQTTFQAIVEHSGRVAAKSSINKMDAKNLAVVFNSVLFGQDQIGSEANLLTMSLEKDSLLEDSITYSDSLFGADDSAAVPGIFPPGAALSRSGVISYHPVDDGPQPGSSRTKFRSKGPVEQGDVPAVTEATVPISTESGPLGEVAQVEEQGDKAIPSDSTAEDAAQPVQLFTPDEELNSSFDPLVIPQHLRDEIGADLHVRPLASTDLMRSHFGLLQTSTVAPPIAPSSYTASFNHSRACPETYYTVVVIDRKTDQMVAHGTVLVEKKYIHGGSSAAHIEDIVVSPSCQGGGLGKKMVLGLRDLALGSGCYKVVSHCKEERIPFYEKCGFEPRSKGMAYYRSDKDLTPQPSLGELAATVPPPAEPSRFGNMLSINTGPPISINSNSDPGDDDGLESPRTVNSTSSSGVTYSFPVPPQPSVPAQTAPTLPPRPVVSHQSSEQTSTEMVNPPPMPPRPTEQPVQDVNKDSIVTSPTAVMDSEIPAAVPAWAAEGLGSSERTIRTPTGSLGPEGVKEDYVGGSARPATPLPPGAAPPNLDEEPERIVEPRG